MKKTSIISGIIIILFVNGFSLFAQTERNLLMKAYPLEKLREIIPAYGEWNPYPKAGESGWQQVPEAVRKGHIELAENNLGYNYETPKASEFLDFVRNGNRSRYQKVYRARRLAMNQLIIGECIEGKGRFTDDILNGVWTICEATFWGVPAHLDLQKRGHGLPDVQEPVVDLFAAETGMFMAWAHYMLSDEFDKISPLINERIKYEVNRRIQEPNLTRTDFWWMGIDTAFVNNWTPWICSNWLQTVLLLEENQEKRVKSIAKIMFLLDKFINYYHEDGGCEEGANYWSRAAASLFDCFEILYNATGGKFNMFEHPLIRKMGQYIYKVHIHDDYFINFADAPVRVHPKASLIYRYGKAIDDPVMMKFGAWLAKRDKLGQGALDRWYFYLERALPLMFTLNELLATEPAVPYIRDTWLPGVQVMAARDAGGTEKGLYLAAQGGHNHESHNHNDVGNFIVYADGYPAIIDVGVEAYTKKTFGPHRYDIWTMQSQYHNLPTVNGVLQMNGPQYRATNVKYREKDKKAEFSLDIGKAWTPEAGIKSWRRTLTLNRGKNITIKDVYSLNIPCTDLFLTLMTWQKPEVVTAGTIRLETVKGVPVLINYDKKKFAAKIEPIEVTDVSLTRQWGDMIYRILLNSLQKKQSDSFTVTISKEK